MNYAIHDNIKTIELVENLLKVAYEILFSFTIPNLISWGKTLYRFTQNYTRREMFFDLKEN